MSQQRSAHIPFAAEDEFLGSDGQRIPPGFHWLPMRPRDAGALTALYALDDTLDPEEAAINRMLAIDDELAELQAQHTGYTNELQLVTAQLATSRKQDEMTRLAALSRPMPTYYAPDDSDEPWDGVNAQYLETHAMLDGLTPHEIANRLEEMGYFALKSLRTKLARAEEAGLTRLPKAELTALLGDQIKRARIVDPTVIDRIAEQLALLTTPPKKTMTVTRPAAPMPTDDIGALLARPMHEQIAAMSSMPTFSPSTPPVPTELVIEETLSFTLRDVLRSVYRALHTFEERHELLVRANRAAHDGNTEAAENVLWQSFTATPRLS